MLQCVEQSQTRHIENNRTLSGLPPKSFGNVPVKSNVAGIEVR